RLPRSRGARAVLTEVLRAGTFAGSLVVGVEQLAAIDRQAAAADARGHPVADCLQRCNPTVEIVAPATREPFPVAAGRRSARRQRVERSADLLERDSRSSTGLDESDPPQDGTLVAPLVSARPLRREESLRLVEADRRRRNPA